MVWFTKLRCRLAAAIACALGPLVAHAATTPAAPRPAVRIAVAPLGYTGPARLYMPYRVPETTLGFLDASHLLFTFHVSRLMHRVQNDPPSDLDQTIHAVVLHLPDGKAVAETDWRLHDRDRYLWMLGNGTFLLRERDALLSGDSSLQLKSYLDGGGTFVFGMLSPDHAAFEAEYSVPAPASAVEGDNHSSAPTLGDDAPRFTAHRRRYTMLIVDTASRTARRVSDLDHPIVLTLAPGGYLTVEQEKSREWAVLLNGWNGSPRKIATLTSTCAPTLDGLSGTVFLATSCQPFSDNHLVQSFDMAGKQLWQQMWQSRFTWGSYAYSLLGNRFAYGSFELDHSPLPSEMVPDTSVLGEPVGVFEVGTGKTDLVLDASPILTAGGNFALSPDGDRLAILRNGAIEIYNLPFLAAPAQVVQAEEHPAHP